MADLFGPTDHTTPTSYKTHKPHKTHKTHQPRPRSYFHTLSVLHFIGHFLDIILFVCLFIGRSTGSRVRLRLCSSIFVARVVIFVGLYDCVLT